MSHCLLGVYCFLMIHLTCASWALGSILGVSRIMKKQYTISKQHDILNTSVISYTVYGNSR